MQICCTKKLLEELSINPTFVEEENDLFCWSAHLLTLNRRKTVVVVNDSNRYGFVLYGLKAKDFKHLDDYIHLGIRQCLKDQHIKDDMIDKYMDQMGNLVFTKTRGSKYVARLNRACECVNLFADRLDQSTLYQVDCSRFMNNDYIRISKESNYESPNELLLQDFRRTYGDQLITFEVVEFMIRLNLGKRSATRRLVVPTGITFRALHKIIQVAFGWQNYHLYEFRLYDQNGTCFCNIMSESDEAVDSPNADLATLNTEVKIAEFVKQGIRMEYCYDFGDNWLHAIRVQQIISDFDKNYSICIMGEGNGPPEDVGGISGYEHFLKIMSDPKHSEYKHMENWASSQSYQDFDIQLVNSRLKHGMRL